ncbi:MAG: BACON domain-containing protein [Porphyromonas sp.]|nr:BACON domain-containing protein [Porphyromonas sp.]
MEPPLPQLTLSEESLNFSSEATQDTIYIGGDKSWHVESDAPWLTIKKKSNESGSDLLIINAAPNTSEHERSAVIKVSIEGIEKSVHVRQEAEKYPDFDWQVFPTVMIKNTKVEKTADGYTYTFEGVHNFINRDVREQVFAGSLVSHIMTRPNKVEEFNRYLKDEVTLFLYASLLGFESVKMRPSAQGVEEAVDKFIATNTLSESGEFYYSNKPQHYSSREELYFLGMGNLGIDLDRLLFGKSYLDEEIQSGKRGYIFSYYMRRFSVMLDAPHELALREEAQNQDFSSRISYIDWVGYGRTGFLFVKTDIPEQDIRIIVHRVAQKEPLSEKQKDMLSKLTFKYLTFDKYSEPSVDTGGVDVIKKYFEEIATGPIIPLSYSLKGLFSHTHTMDYQVKIPRRARN